MSLLDTRAEVHGAGPVGPTVDQPAPSRRRSRSGHRLLAPGLLLSALWLALVVVAAFAPGLLTATDPYAADTGALLQPPSAGHWFGTDQIGRDLFSRVVHGSALSLQATLVAVGVGVVLGATVGLLAGAAGGWLDAVLMRAVDVLLAIPSLLLSLALITVLGFGTVNVAIAVGFGSVAGCARIMRSEVLRVRQSVYVEAATSLGVRRRTVVLRHVLPNAAGPVLVLAALDFGTAILAVSSLSFLGYGAKPPTPEWGSLVASGRDFLGSGWWLTTLPGLVVVATVLAANRIARALERGRGGADA
ncbi:peptide/nickel transport system permease protein [Friedmanniella luteola]|uniref:Peptide/nickel transport system permease protein n=1 Tax=Friedmanniella luteola TaxID=546871 RepID=A0A1H1WIC0_9ACTN|nr:ABC transporter permease [Friedmanniella luteola]SDS96410.1 peptide/nickel transport system permease protein [Friedmanniella luteola]